MIPVLRVLLLSVMVCFHQAESLQLSTISSKACNPNPCQNGGKCFDEEKTANGHECACVNGFYGQKCNKQRCPEGFEYLCVANTCVKMMIDPATWDEAQARCQKLHGSYLTIINDAEEANDQARVLQSYKKEIAAKCSGLTWIGARRKEANCKAPFVWKPNAGSAISVTYSNWQIDEPNCFFGLQLCVSIQSSFNFQWNDRKCDEKFCYVCESGPYE